MIEYFLNYYGRLLTAWREHIYLLMITMAVSIIISAVISFLIYRIPALTKVVVLILKIIYTIPSLAFFAILIPISGIGATTAIIALVSYALFFLVSSFLDGLQGIDPKVVEAGKAMGYSSFQLFIKVQLPLCMPSILNGIRLAAISTISISCIAYAIGAGGVGSILFEGMRQLSYIKIFWGAVLVVILNIIVNAIFLNLERYYIRRFHLDE